MLFCKTFPSPDLQKQPLYIIFSFDRKEKSERYEGYELFGENADRNRRPLLFCPSFRHRAPPEPLDPPAARMVEFINSIEKEEYKGSL